MFASDIEAAKTALKAAFPAVEFDHNITPTSGVTSLSWRPYAEANALTEWKAKEAVKALVSNPPAGARVVSVSFDGQRGKPTPYLVDAGLSDQEAVAAIEAATGRKVKKVRASSI